MKKSLWIVLILMLACVLMLTACDNEDQTQTPNDTTESGTDTHVHAFGKWATVKEATCIDKGEQERTCSCGEKETKVVDIVGHNEVIDAAVSPTCTAEGKTEGKHCSTCGMMFVEQTSIPVVDHTYDNEEDEKCNVCDFVRDVNCKHTSTETIEAVAPTCTKNGLTEGKKCAKCEEILVAQNTVSKLGHKEVIDEAVAATCTTEGKTEGKHCSRCNETLVAQNTVNKLGHIEVTDKAVAATCTTEGKTEGKHCSRCNETLVAQTTVSKLGHIEVIDAGVATTCTTEGKTEGKHCSRCNETLVEQTKIDKLGHKEVIDASVAATCTTDGKTEGKHCSRCNETLVAQTTVGKLGHVEVTDKAVAATCTTDGKTEGKHCSRCNETLVSQTAVNKLGHIEVTDAAVAATCTTDGKTEGKHCSRCDEVLVAQTKIDKLGHKETVGKSGKAATCTESGLTEEKICSVCKAVLVNQSVIPAKGHTEVIDKAVAATCTTEGKTEGKHCSACNEVIVAQKIVPSIGHSFNDGEIISEATCKKTGTKKFTCLVTNCQYSYTESYSLSQYTATELYSQSVKYVGEIVTYDKKGNEYAIGTGFVISSDGKILTNYHVIEKAYSATICINGITYNIVSVLAYDANIDLAVLKINATNLIAARICKNTVQTGETVYAIGSSRGMTNTYSQGIITYANRVIDGISYVQHDASITHGNSGGPLINAYGEVIGINTWGISDSQNLNFAVFTAELDKLVYGTPMTLAEFYEANFNAYETLLNWLLDNYNYTGNNQIEYRYQESGERFSVYTLTYFYETNTLSLIYFYVFDNDDTRYVSIDLFEDTTFCRYYARYTDGDYSYKENETEGYIYPSSFTRYTPLEYSSSEGDYWTLSSLLVTYQEGMVYSLEWFNVFLDVFELGLTLSDFGFNSFS